MAYCPTCKQSFASDVTTCPTDRVDLVTELPYQTIEGDGRTWVEIASTGGSDEATVLQGFLENEGIDCQIESLRFSMEPINFGTMGEVRVYVPAEQEQKAMELLRSREAQYEALPDEDSLVTDEGVAQIDESSQAETNGE